jgi:hypothetical protein
MVIQNEVGRRKGKVARGKEKGSLETNLSMMLQMTPTNEVFWGIAVGGGYGEWILRLVAARHTPNFVHWSIKFLCLAAIGPVSIKI